MRGSVAGVEAGVGGEIENEPAARVVRRFVRPVGCLRLQGVGVV
jgi:hypothetical protein